MGQAKFEQAVQDFSFVMQQYPGYKKLPDVRFLKGMALRLGGHAELAISEWRVIIQMYPQSEAAFNTQREIDTMLRR